MKARVIPNAKSFQVSFDGILKIRVCSPASEGKANDEVVKKLSKLLGEKVAIVRGLKSREKEIVIGKLSDNEVVEKVNSLSSQ